MATNADLSPAPPSNVETPPQPAVRPPQTSSTQALPATSSPQTTASAPATPRPRIMSGPLPANQTPVTTPPPPTPPGTTRPTPTPAQPLPNSSPVQTLDWQTRMQAGNTDAQTRQVQGNETVAQQLTDLTAGDSRYIDIARDKARREASGRGMMMSSMAAGNAERSAIEAAMPIAQQDASTYSRVASENMAAVNTDRLADQNQFGQLVGQELGIRANLDEGERNRVFQGNESQAQRDAAAGEAADNRSWQSFENTQNRSWQQGENVLARQYESSQRQLDREFQGTQQERQFAQQRFQDFNAAMVNLNQQLTQTLVSIYSNPNLKPNEQAAAAANARAVHQSLMNSYAATLAAGVPQIFWNPYPMNGTWPQPTNPTNPNNGQGGNNNTGGGGTNPWGGGGNPWTPPGGSVITP